MQHSDALTTARTALPRLRAELVQRPLLQQQLRLALQSRKLVLLCAPAGYGKTVALAQQLSALPAEYAVAWVAASEGNGLHALLTALFALRRKGLVTIRA